MGECPVYSVEILRDGTVNYFGEYFVDKIGTHTWRIDSKSVKLLNDAIVHSGYFRMKEKTITVISTCQPSCITSILLEDDSFREIENDYGENRYPKKLSTFENKIDELIQVEKYIGSPDRT